MCLVTYPVIKTLISNWYESSFIMVVYENFFQSSVRIFCPKHNLKFFSHKQPLKTTCGSVRNEFSSCRVLLEPFLERYWWIRKMEKKHDVWKILLHPGSICDPIRYELDVMCITGLPIGESKGGETSTTCSKTFQFHAVLGEIWQNRMLMPPRRLVPPPRGNHGSAIVTRLKSDMSTL